MWFLFGFLKELFEALSAPVLKILSVIGDQDPDPHWFGFLDFYLPLGKKLDPHPH
jgi:hypothetical protein